MRKFLLLIAASAVLCLSALAIKAPINNGEGLRLIVSAGALAEQNPYSAFYQSRIFKSEVAAPFVITNADAIAFATDDAIFYASAPVLPADIISAAAADKFTSMSKIMVGHSYRGLLLTGAANENIRSHLGADSIATKVVKTKVGNTEILAVSMIFGTDVVWPKRAEELRPIPAVVISDKNSSYALLARSVGSLAQRLGVVDNLLAHKAANTGWLDLGTSAASATITSASVKAALARPLLAELVGSLELATLITDKDRLASVPMVAPLGDSFKRVVRIGTDNINLWSVTHGEAVWDLYGRIGKSVDLVDAIKLMKQEADAASKEEFAGRNLNVVRVYSEQAAMLAANSVYVDLVLLLASDPYAQLPTREVIELRHAETDAYEQIAPIVHIDYLDASELRLYQKGTQKIQRIEVTRHGFTNQAPRAKDAPIFSIDLTGTVSQGADNRWTKGELEKILGGIMLKEAKADVAVFPALPNMTIIDSPIPTVLAKQLMEQHGNIVVVTISGRQVKRVAKLIGANHLNRKHIMYGIDQRSLTQGTRSVNDKERYDVALSEEALLDIFWISRLGGLSEDYALRAPFVSAIYADSKQLFYIGGQKTVPITDTADELERAVREIKAGISFERMLDSGLAHITPAEARNFIASAKGKPHHAITLDIAYLDLGISKNVVNHNYEKASGTFPTSRGGIPPYAHVFIYNKTALNYETPVLNTTFFSDIKYMHTNFEEKPERDKTKLGLKFRLPWEHSYFKDESVVVSPIFTNVYETKLTPSFWVDNANIRKKPRPRRIDSLLGVNVDFTKLGFNFDIGAAMATDFNRYSVTDALDFGPGLNFLSRWRLFGPFELSSDIQAVYLFPLPNSRALNKVALAIDGTVWLRVARFYDFGVDAMSDFLVATVQDSPNKLILSSIFGLTISYGRFFRLMG